MIVQLSSIAKVALGYKSLQNNFYYVNRATIDTFGIEAEFVRPIAMLRDLKPLAYLQKVEPKTWLFYCDRREPDLRGTGALRYIQSMADRPASEKKQSGKAQTVR